MFCWDPCKSAQPIDGFAWPPDRCTDTCYQGFQVSKGISQGPTAVTDSILLFQSIIYRRMRNWLQQYNEEQQINQVGPAAELTTSQAVNWVFCGNHAPAQAIGLRKGKRNIPSVEVKKCQLVGEHHAWVNTAHATHYPTGLTIITCQLTQQHHRLPCFMSPKAPCCALRCTSNTHKSSGHLASEAGCKCVGWADATTVL